MAYKYSKLFRYRDYCPLMKLINTPFWYDKRTGDWIKKVNIERIRVDFEVVLKEIPEYMLDDLLFNINEL